MKAGHFETSGQAHQQVTKDCLERLSYGLDPIDWHHNKAKILASPEAAPKKRRCLGADAGTYSS